MIDFSDPPINTNYSSTAEPNEAGLQILYDITDIFLDAVVKGSKLLPDGFMDKFNDLPDFIERFPGEVTENAVDVVEANTAIIATVGVGLVLTILMPIIGIFFCCCHGCGKCGGKREPPQKSDGLKRILLGILFFIFIVIATLGCVWFFSGNGTAKKGTEELPQAMKNFIKDDELFVNNTKLQFNYLLDNNFKEAENEFERILNDTATVDIPNLTDDIIIGTNLNAINETANIIQELIKIYNKAATQLNDIKEDIGIVDGILNNITITLEDCKNTLKCKEQPPVSEELCDKLNEIAGIIEGVDIDSVIKKIPDLSNLDSGVIEPILEILTMAFDNINEVTNSFVDEYFQKMKDQVSEIGDDLLSQGKNIDEMLDTLTIPALLSMTNDELDNEINNMEVFIEDNYSIFEYSLIGFGSITAVILAVFIISLAMGSCESAGSKTSHCASRLICVTLGIFFFFAIFLFLVATIFFIVGAVGEKFVCRTLGEPEDAQIIKLINPLFNTTLNKAISEIADKEVHIDWNIASMIASIHQGATVYNIFHLEFIYDINNLSDWRTTFEIDSVLDTARQGIDDTISTVETQMVIDETTRNNIMEMAENFNTFVPNLNNTLDIALGDLLPINETDQAISKIDEIINVAPDFIKEKLWNIQNDMETIRDILPEIITSWDNTTTDVEEVMAMLNNSKPTDIVTKTFENFEEAKVWISGEGKEDVLIFFNNTVEKVLNVIDEFVNYGINTVNNDLGGMTPVSGMWNATDASLCQNLLDPFNSVWSGLGWTLLFILLPLSIVSCSLMSIYGRTKEELVQPFQFQKGNLKMNPRSQATVGLDEIDMRNYSGGSQIGGDVHYAVPDHHKASQQVPYTVPDYYKPTQQSPTLSPEQNVCYTVPDHYKPSQQHNSTIPDSNVHYAVPDQYKPSNNSNSAQSDSKIHYTVPDHYKPSAPHRYEVPLHYRPNQQ